MRAMLQADWKWMMAIAAVVATRHGGVRLGGTGRRVVKRYSVADHPGLTRCPTLVVAPTCDPHVHPVALRAPHAIA
jgi:hypothetical protein